MQDAYQIVTDRMLSLVDEAGQWTPPWHRTKLTMPRNAVSGHEYQGCNVFMCWITAYTKGYRNNSWATFKQWQAKGGSVRKGEKGTPILFFKEYAAENDNGDAETRAVARLSYVFNPEQVDGIEQEPAFEPANHNRLPEIEWFIRATGARIIEGGNKAAYAPALDAIYMPALSSFKTPEHYYSTAFHELVHWTGAKNRLDRQLSTRFKSDAYAAEELIAEMGAAFLAADWSIANIVREDHAAYLKSWLDIMKKDKRALVTAASQASKAVAYLRAQTKLTERIAA